MPSTNIISGTDLISKCKKDELISTIEPKQDKNLASKSVSVKENKFSTNFCYNGSQMRLIDESDLEDLLVVKENQQKTDGNNPIVMNDEDWDQYYAFPRLLLTSGTNENQLDPFILQPSLFHKNHVPPTVYFDTKNSEDSRPPVGLPKRLQYFFKWKISSITPNSIRNCINFMKFDIIKPSNTTDNLYLGSWCKHMLTAEFEQLEEWRKVNHYPGSFHLGRKDKLWFRLKMATQKFGREKFGEFHPTTFVLPRDYDELRNYWTNSPSKLFIMKPPASARGNGIKVINDISQIPTSALDVPPHLDGTLSKKSTMIVQQYISNPCLLENGQKFDLRIYVLLTSIDPLRVYIYDDGLVRFASSKYTSQEEGIIDQYMHLTNYFINKNNQEYQINNDCDSLYGCKWSLKRFWRYLSEHYAHVDVHKLCENIEDIVIKTIICCEGPMTRLSHQTCKNDYTSYELFGFDIILDENFKPWILEVNITPSLKSESDLDTTVKYAVIKDMFNLVGYNLPPMTEELSKLGNYLGNNRLFFDNRLYSAQNLSKRDKIKHLKYQKLHKGDQGIQKQSTTRDGMSRDRDLASQTSSEVPKDRCTQIDNACNDNDDSVKLNILNDLTQEDMRVLMLTEDELSRCGQFKRVFPSATSNKYLKYFDKPRYYNLLLDAWEQKYKDDRLEGVSRLSNLANFLD